MGDGHDQLCRILRPWVGELRKDRYSLAQILTLYLATAPPVEQAPWAFSMPFHGWKMSESGRCPLPCGDANSGYRRGLVTG